jgi:hypothetical protein
MSEQKIDDEEFIADEDLPEDIRGKEPPKFLTSGDSIIEGILARRTVKKYEPIKSNKQSSK